MRRRPHEWSVHGETPSGCGVYGLTTNNTATSVGVRGEMFSTNGVGVEAKYCGIVFNNSPTGVYYNSIRSKWEIFNENNAAIPNNAQFNVLVLKQ